MNIQHPGRANGASKPPVGEIRRFRKTVYDYFRKHGRSLPWRREYDPYHILVSEIMLQQTQVSRVAPKFEAFVTELPDFSALARAPLKQVLALWQGLGYNRRALHLKRAAEIVATKHLGTLPSSSDELLALPGIGKATAASIAAFAFNSPAIFLETNIRTALIGHFFNGRESVADEELLPVAGATLDRKHPRKWYSALMDYGSMLKRESGNASRRSAHYKTQSRFEGSKRQLRGAVVRLLLSRRKMNIPGMLDYFPNESERLEAALTELVAENIVVYRNGNYTIA